MAGLDASVALTRGRPPVDRGASGLMLFGTESSEAALPAPAGHGGDRRRLRPDRAGRRQRRRRDPDPRRARSRGGDYVLNGSKMWITNGGLADVFTVFARTSAAEDGVKPQITAFLVERGAGRHARARTSTSSASGAARPPSLHFERRAACRRANVLGEVGRGFKVAMEVLNSGRLGLASGCVGDVQAGHQDVGRAVPASAARSGGPSASSASIKDKIADDDGRDVGARVHDVPDDRDWSTPAPPTTRVESAICKVYGSETCWRVVNEALADRRRHRLHGGVPVRAVPPRRAHQPRSSRGPTRSCGRSSR